VANKRDIRRDIKQLQKIKTWQLLILLVIFGLLAATFLRLNNIGMIERRTAVLQADKTGDATSLQNNLYALQRYSTAHMNAASGIIYLNHSYQRDSQKAIDDAKNTSNVAVKDVLDKADAACKAQYAGNWMAYVQCNAAEQAKYAGSNTLQASVKFPNADLYKQEFISPMWSPDFAGWSLVICAAITGVILLRLLSLAILQLLLRQRFNSI